MYIQQFFKNLLTHSMHSLSLTNLSLLLLWIIILCDAKYSKYDQIDAEDSTQYSPPLIVSLRYDCQDQGDPTTHCCSGIVLTKSHILTTADCVDRFPSDITFVVGVYDRSESDQLIRKIDQIIIHPKWTTDRHSFNYNIALLRISDPLDLTADKYITLTYSMIASNLSKAVLNYPSNAMRLSVIQWNLAKQSFETSMSTNRQQTKMSLADNNDSICNRFIDDMEHQFCARFYHTSKNACNYEPGEPILQWTDNGWMQFGIISSVIKETDGNCLKIYTRIAYYHKWIASVLNFETVTSATIVTTTDSISNLTNTYECNVGKVSCGCSVKNVVLSPMRIIGGEEAVAHSWGMAVSIRLNDSEKHVCGGSILTESYVLTSAHCVDAGPALEVWVAAGMHNRIDDFFHLRYAHEVHIHPNWNRNDSTYRDDIALLYIAPPLPVQGSDNFAQTCVPYINSLNETINYPSSGSHLAIIGWGSTENDSNNMSVTLQQASIYTLDNNDPVCSQSIHDVEKQFCAGIQRGDPCQGDEGGPIFQWKGTYWEQVGITSYGGKCDQVDSPSIFTRLAYYFDWMESVTGISLTTTTPKPPPIPTSYSCNKTSSCGCGKFDVALTSSRIVGGENAIENSWPMIVSIRLNETINHSCGGTILSKSYILTAAHCLRQVSVEHPTRVTVAAGMTNRSDPLQIIRQVDRIYIHPNYTGMPRDNRHDIALLHVNEPFNFESNSSVTKTCIHRIDPPLPTNQHPKNGTRLSVIGWGTLGSGDGSLPEILQQAEVFTIGNEESTCVTSINDTELQFCAGLYEGGKDSCQGDSGGPIFQWTGQYWEQVGIVSYGRGCAQAGFPGIYTRLSYYYHWMAEVLEHDGEYLEPNIPSSATTNWSFLTTIFGLFVFLL